MTNTIRTGDAIAQLQEMDSGSIHMCMTSPPYWNLRDYGEPDQLGLEATPEEFVENLADVFDEVKRVLRDDGSLWLNLGDTYDNKDLQQIPARVALELQDRGWILRNRVTWTKPNPMPSSVKDRLNNTTEAIFHFVKNKEYWYDLDAIREEYSEVTKKKSNNGYKMGDSKFSETNSPGNHDSAGGMNDPDQDWDAFMNPAGKNPGDVFEVTTKPFPKAHFAVYPPELCEKPIKATCPPRVCVECGSPYEREVAREERGDNLGRRDDPRVHENSDANLAQAPSNWEPPEVDFKGWKQTCDCDTDMTEAGIALDPFAGAGTTLLKAKELRRKFAGIELNPEYADMARARIGLDVHDASVVREDDSQQGLEQF